MDPETKLFVVIAVIAIILAGIAGFLFFLEYRLKKAEKMLDDLSREPKKAKT